MRLALLIAAVLLATACSDPDPIIPSEPDRQFTGGRFDEREPREGLREGRTDDDEQGDQP